MWDFCAWGDIGAGLFHIILAFILIRHPAHLRRQFQGTKSPVTYVLTYLCTYLLTYVITYLLTYLLTHSIQQSPPWEDNRFSASQEIPHILWNPRVHYLIHKCPPTVPILSQLDPVHTHTSHFLKIHLNIILLSMPGSPKWSLSFRFPHQKPVHAYSLSHTRYMPRPSHFSRFYYPRNIGLAVQIIKLLIM